MNHSYTNSERPCITFTTPFTFHHTTIGIENPKTSARPDSLVISYLTLRKMVGILALSLAPAMVLGSFIFDHPPHIQISLSAYYHTHMRDLFIGIICGIALFLLSYNGYTKHDALCSRLAGLFALCIAFL